MTITWEVVSAVLVLLGAVSGVWWRVEGMIRRNTDDLAAHRLHIAEVYVTKAGMTEQTAQIMAAINGVSGKLDHLTGRIDALYKPAARRSGGQ
ncbi:MAG TPA: hypothetical protein VNS12_13685 [Pelagibacterium sp.]|uniref:hypothetical protein n=1 Tax=Pelagibacterium sp. TaxID=1967288 RepID=UPI002C2A73B8|nr:hypothetical protein [Pelagibacterium sp.]HWJ89114.1 hypothetical protein [Pelagibacterium sp.]